MKSRTIIFSILGAAIILVLVERRLAHRSRESSTAVEGNSSVTSYHSVNPFPLTYPVTDRARSLIRFVRDEISLTSQHMQSMGSSRETITSVLGAIREWVEPRQDALDGIRDEYLAARSAWLSCRGKVYSAQERLKLVRERGDDGAFLEEGLRQEVKDANEILPEVERHYRQVEVRLTNLMEPIATSIGKVLPPHQRLLWLAARKNAPSGLPVAVWFVPDLDDLQCKALKRGEDASNVLTASQRVISDTALENYRSNRQAVRQAELAFFFGRKPDSGSTSTDHSTVVVATAGETRNATPADAPSATASHCPLHFGRAKSGTAAETPTQYDAQATK